TKCSSFIMFVWNVTFVPLVTMMSTSGNLYWIGHTQFLFRSLLMLTSFSFSGRRLCGMRTQWKCSINPKQRKCPILWRSSQGIRNPSWFTAQATCGRHSL
uniref:Uncharacterized protein n=1 Tax=Aegilops tauschii subsp. strangulata TaxID=200361 RepID=A0A453SDR2_AEGTS